MGKKATKAADNIFYQARINASNKNNGFSSRENASEILKIDRTRLARIELDEIMPYPEEIIKMATEYNSPELTHIYCSKLCPLGKLTMPALNDSNDFDRIVLQILGSIEDLSSLKTKLIDIAEDGTVTPDETADFQTILNKLDRISSNAQSLKIWAEKNIKEISNKIEC